MRALLILCLFSLIPTVAFAQFSPSGLGDVEPTLALSPEYPEPNQTVSVRIDNYLSNLYSSEINWYFNGKLLTDKKNQRDVEITVGAIGSRNLIEAIFDTPTGAALAAKATIKPVYLDVIVEPQTHVPSFYQGRPLPSMHSRVNLISILSGINTPSTDLIYTWRINDEIIGRSAGRGRNVVSYETPPTQTVIISLEVSNLYGQTIARRSIAIPTATPLLRFYEVSTLYGINNRPATEFNLIANSATIKAEPYYLDSAVYNNPDISEWDIEGTKTQNAGNPYEINLERLSYNGTSRVGFHVRSMTELLQGTRASIKVNY